MKKTIAVLGGGPAGVALAMKLLRRDDLDANIVVLEQGDEVGGLASSFTHYDIRFDQGSHRLHPVTAPELLADIRELLGEDLLDRPRNGRIRLMGRFLKFPLSPVDLLTHMPPRFALGLARDILTKPFSKKIARDEEETFAGALMGSLGRTICSSFYFPYAVKLWGLAPDQISATQAHKRVSANSITKIMAKVLSALQGGKRHTRRFFYPREGYGQIATAMAEEVTRLGGDIRLSTRVNSIRGSADGRFCMAVETLGVGNSELHADFVFSTIPVTVLVRCLGEEAPEGTTDHCRQLSYRQMVLAYLVLDVDRFTPYDAHYFPECDVVFSRVSEPKNYSDRGTPKGVTGLCFEIPCSSEDSIWSLSDDALRERLLEDMARAGLPITARVVSQTVRRLKTVYPIYDLDYASHLSAVDSGLETVSNLVTLGRQGLFTHDNTHHTVEMAYRACDCLGANLRWDAKRWKAYKKEFESHVVED